MPAATSALVPVGERQAARWKVVVSVAVAVVALTAASYFYFHRTGNTAPTDNRGEELPIQPERQPVHEDQNAQVEQPKDSAELGIRTLLSAWTESFREKDLASQIDCYAPVMDTYFLRHNVSRDFVQADKSRTFSGIKEVRIFEISDITIEFASSSNAIVKFGKKWDTSLASGKTFSGEEIEQLQIANLDGGWKIVSEKEIQIVKVEGHSSP